MVTSWLLLKVFHTILTHNQFNRVERQREEDKIKQEEKRQQDKEEARARANRKEQLLWAKADREKRRVFQQKALALRDKKRKEQAEVSSFICRKFAGNCAHSQAPPLSSCS